MDEDPLEGRIYLDHQALISFIGFGMNSTKYLISLWLFMYLVDLVCLIV